jgi:hypothetical protein
LSRSDSNERPQRHGQTPRAVAAAGKNPEELWHG